MIVSHCSALDVIMFVKTETIKTMELCGRHAAEAKLWGERFSERTTANHIVFAHSIQSVRLKYMTLGKPFPLIDAFQVLDQEGGPIPYIMKVTLDELMSR